MGAYHPRFTDDPLFGTSSAGRSAASRSHNEVSAESEHDAVNMQTVEERARQRHAELLARLASSPPRTFFASLVAENPWILSLELGLFPGRPGRPSFSLPAAEPCVSVKSGINLLKSSLRLVPEEREAGRVYRLHFALDSTDACTVRTHLGVKEVLQLVDPDSADIHDDVVLPQFVPERGNRSVPFVGGFGQLYQQPESECIDPAFFSDALEADVDIGYYPVVIIVQSAGFRKVPAPNDGASASPRVTAQLTYASLSAGEDGTLSIKPLKQKLILDDRSYLVQDVFGLENDGKDSGRECVICLTEARRIVLLPCLHMCLCTGCAETFRQQSNACPICRSSVRSMIEVRLHDEPAPAVSESESGGSGSENDDDEVELTKRSRHSPEDERQLLSNNNATS
eukprot:TRINITY_DN7960_c0_g1_i2.p1 TRINITY_DN7960_c0_g1~~TRINITY_DN7960_c0_g1_i2.p1  ORF type:complete len:398 (-),score=107.84 TRINITY_DN7960_c0_g1_i2:197-1390(-)